MMDLGKVKEAIDAAESAMMLGGIEPRDCEVFENGLGAIEYLRLFIAELEKPADDDAKKCAEVLKVAADRAMTVYARDCEGCSPRLSDDCDERCPYIAKIRKAIMEAPNA